MFALILALGMIFSGCGSEESDTWTTVTELSQLNGTWTNSYYKTMTVKEWYAVWKKTWSSAQEQLYGNIKMTWGYEGTETINSRSNTRSYRGVQKRTFSGDKINTQWSSIKANSEWSGFTRSNNDEHSLSYSYSNSGSLVGLNLSNIQINKNGTKLKWKQNMPSSYGGEVVDLIYTKQ